MKWLLCLGVLALGSACAPIKTLEELEAEALRTGDWTLVEQRERLIEKRNARKPPSCPAGQISYCEKNIGILLCHCVSKAVMTTVIASR